MKVVELVVVGNVLLELPITHDLCSRVEDPSGVNSDGL